MISAVSFVGASHPGGGGGGSSASPSTSASVTTPASPGAPAAGGSVFYSVQVAAYGSEEAAQRVAKLLVERGLQARVDGTTAPFRVRIGRYATRAEATKAMQLLKSQGHPGFVAQVGGR